MSELEKAEADAKAKKTRVDELQEALNLALAEHSKALDTLDAARQKAAGL